MRITITGVESPGSSSAITFRSVCGEGQGRWLGEVPKSGSEYDVELALRGRVIVRRCTPQPEKNRATMTMTTTGVSMIGAVEEVLVGGGCALRMQDSVVMVDGPVEGVIKGDVIEVLADGLDIYDARM